MGYFKELEIEILEMAHDMGDDFGSERETIERIALVFQLSFEEVKMILQNEGVSK